MAGLIWACNMLVVYVSSCPQLLCLTLRMLCNCRKAAALGKLPQKAGFSLLMCQSKELLLLVYTDTVGWKSLWSFCRRPSNFLGVAGGLQLFQIPAASNSLHRSCWICCVCVFDIRQRKAKKFEMLFMINKKVCYSLCVVEQSAQCWAEYNSWVPQDQEGCGCGILWLRINFIGKQS